MATPAVTYTFAANTLIKASEANTNFQDIVDFLTNEVIQKDASTAFTATPSGPAADPTTANQFARKAYVDNRYRLVRSFSEANNRDGITSGWYEIPGSSVTHTFVSGRNYRFSAKLALDMTAGTGYMVSVLNGGAEYLRLAQDNSFASTGRIVVGWTARSNLTGSLTLGLGVTSPFGTVNVTGATVATEFLIEDLGTV